MITIAFARIAATWPWYIVRGAGFAAAALLLLLMLSGIGQVTGHTYRLLEPAKAWAIHRAMGIALCFMVATHVLFLLIDHSLRFSVPQLLIPFISGYQPIWVGLGIIAMYGLAIVVASSLGWIETKKKQWKQLHFVSYGVVALVFLHALYSGTDLAYGVFRDAWIGLGLILLLGILMRLWRAGTMRKLD